MEDYDFKKIGLELRRLRTEHACTQEHIADELGCTVAFISNVENNRTAMSLRILMYYAKLMNISLDSLIGKVEPEYKKTALDNELQALISKMEDGRKRKLLETLKIWQDE